VGCQFHAGPLPGWPAQEVFVALRFADPSAIPIDNAGPDSFLPMPDERVSSVSIAVKSYDPPIENGPS
jgi:hypothetical protein